MLKFAIEQFVPVDGPVDMGMRESNKLVPNWRFRGHTQGVEWVVDIYRGGWCYVAVGRFSERVNSPMSAIRFLMTHLASRGVL
jgi:hypothetical protein